VPVSATTPELQPLRARLAAFSRWALVEDRPAATAPAREAFLGKFDTYPDPGSARKAYFTRLSLQSAMARAAKARGTAQREAATDSPVLAAMTEASCDSPAVS